MLETDLTVCLRKAKAVAVPKPTEQATTAEEQQPTVEAKAVEAPKSAGEVKTVQSCSFCLDVKTSKLAITVEKTEKTSKLAFTIVENTPAAPTEIGKGSDLDSHCDDGGFENIPDSDNQQITRPAQTPSAHLQITVWKNGRNKFHSRADCSKLLSCVHPHKTKIFTMASTDTTGDAFCKTCFQQRPKSLKSHDGFVDAF